jgi:hypothetical protein
MHLLILPVSAMQGVLKKVYPLKSSPLLEFECLNYYYRVSQKKPQNYWNNLLLEFENLFQHVSNTTVDLWWSEAIWPPLTSFMHRGWHIQFLVFRLVIHVSIAIFTHHNSAKLNQLCTKKYALFTAKSAISNTVRSIVKLKINPV